MARMRGTDDKPAAMFSYVSAEERVPQDHPLRRVRAFVDEILRRCRASSTRSMRDTGVPRFRPSGSCGRNCSSCSTRFASERLLMEQLDDNILFRWFVGLEMDEPIWVPTVFSKNRDRLLQHAVAHSFFQRVVARATDLMSDEHFTVDGTLLEAWASQKSCQRKDGNTDGDGSDFRGQTRKNETHASRRIPMRECIASRTTPRRA